MCWWCPNTHLIQPLGLLPWWGYLPESTSEPRCQYGSMELPASAEPARLPLSQSLAPPLPSLLKPDPSELLPLIKKFLILPLTKARSHPRHPALFSLNLCNSLLTVCSPPPPVLQLATYKPQTCHTIPARRLPWRGAPARADVRAGVSSSP